MQGGIWQDNPVPPQGTCGREKPQIQEKYFTCGRRMLPEFDPAPDFEEGANSS